MLEVALRKRGIKTMNNEIEVLIVETSEGTQSYDLVDAESRANITALSGTVTTIQGNVTTLQGNVSTLQGAVTTLQGDVSDLETEVGGKLTDVNLVGTYASADKSLTLSLAKTR